jgi:3-dehydroquinate synthase
MEDLPVHDFKIRSHSGPYFVTFTDEIIFPLLGTHYIIDEKVYATMGLNLPNVVLIDATEENKSYRGIEPVITQLLKLNLKRDSTLVAIGGGITQDIACFIATTFMRGIEWVFVPTTLLAQADSCIGSKSSINFNNYKNLLGSFSPPNHVYISTDFLDTLEDKDFKSGIGEIIKLFLVASTPIQPKEITRANVKEYIRRALIIKKRFIEADEFDQDIRQILNYGHCIGHGIESATNFAIPHGIAITMGMDVVNRFAYLEGLIDLEWYETVHKVLFENYKDFCNEYIDSDKVCNALTKDKKNTGSKINFVLPVNGSIVKRGFEPTNAFWLQVYSALAQTPIKTRS